MYHKFFLNLRQHVEWWSILLALPCAAVVVLKAMGYTTENPSYSGAGDAKVAGAVFLPFYLITVVGIRVWIEGTCEQFTGALSAFSVQIKSDIFNLLVVGSLFGFYFLSHLLPERAPVGLEVFALAISDSFLIWTALVSFGALLLSINFFYKSFWTNGSSLRLRRFGILVIACMFYGYILFFVARKLTPGAWLTIIGN